MMNFVTIGVAGHTNHGKTTLIRALTGLPACSKLADKGRKPTVECGIVPYDTAEYGQHAFIDIPGHLRYLKNAVRGLYAVDMAILVIAANDGVMPQTLEHLKIITHLGICSGFVVLTKTDRVDPELIELARMEVQDATVGTVFEHRPVICCSAESGTGLEAVRMTIGNEMAQVPPKPADGPLQLWIDRVRTVQGFGTVGCGTLLSGTIHADDKVRILPTDQTSRIRSLEVHHQKVEKALAGQRVGLNLPGFSAGDLCCGMMLAGPQHPSMSCFLNARVCLNQQVKNGQRVRLYMGTAAVNARIVLMEKPVLGQGESGWVQVRLPNPLPACPGEKFVFCSLNRHGVLGGGRVFEVSDRKYKTSRHTHALAYLRSLEENNGQGIIDNYCRLHFSHPVTAAEISDYAGICRNRVQKKLTDMVTSNTLRTFPDGRYYRVAAFDKLCKLLPETINTILTKDPFQGKTNKKAVTAHLPHAYDAALLEAALDRLNGEKKIIHKQGAITMPLKYLSLSKSQKQIIHALQGYINKIGVGTFSVRGFCHDEKNGYKKEKVQPFVDCLCFQGKLVCLKDNNYMAAHVMENVKKRVQRTISEKGSITITDCKSVLGFGRTKGVPVFEYLDDIGFTIREGNERMLRM